MDDEQPSGSGQANQHGNYTRPFFYVQPPNQPYHHQPYHHQPYHHWHLNNPYYGLPPGYPYARPFMPPYPYMPFPGCVAPPAPVHPVDYRRLFEPHMYPNVGQDVRFRHHQHHHHFQQQQQPYFRREMTCSEVQTDPSAALNKIIESLEKLRASEMDKELDSGVASQTSGMFSPGHKKQQQHDEEVEAAAAGTFSVCASLKDSQSSPAMGFSDTATSVYNDRSDQSLMEDLDHPKCWPHNSDEELPLGSSSVHEDTDKPQHQEEEQPEGHCPPRLQDTDSQCEISRASPDSTSKAKAPQKHSHDLIVSPSLSSTRISDWEALQHEDHISKIDYHQQSTDGRDLTSMDTDLVSKILKLPFKKVLTAEALQRESPLLCAKSHALLPSTNTSSPAHSYYPGYWPPHSTHERMSILSPSVDELSSRDEMFSTDLDDLDLYPKHKYSHKSFADAVVDLPSTSNEVVWPKRLLCACCGMSLSKRTMRSKAHCPQPYEEDEEGDSDEGHTFGRCTEHLARHVIKKPLKKSHSLSVRHASKDVRCHDKDLPGIVNKQEELDSFAGPESSGQDPEDLRHRTYQGDTLDQNRWECQDAQPKRKMSSLPQRHDRLRQRKPTYMPHPVYHGSREDKGEEPPQCHRVKRIPQ